MATVHPMGHESQIPVLDPSIPDRMNARITRRIRSVNVAIIKGTIAAEPRSTPSATSLMEMTK